MECMKQIVHVIFSVSFRDKVRVKCIYRLFVNIFLTFCQGQSSENIMPLSPAYWRCLWVMFIATISFSVRSFHFLLQRFLRHAQQIGETVEVPPFLFAYSVGQNVPAGDDCNTCTCNADGRVTCTDKSTLNICTRFKTLALTTKVKSNLNDHNKII